MAYEESKKRKNRVTILFTDEEVEGLKEFLETSEHTSLANFIRNALSEVIGMNRAFEKLSSLLRLDSYRGGRPKGSKNKPEYLDSIYDSLKNKTKRIEDLFDYENDNN